MIKLNIRQAMDLALLAIAERGEDYVYDPPAGRGGDCMYYDFDNAVPSCAVGQIMHYVGLNPELYEEYGWNEDTNVAGLFEGLNERDLGETDEETLLFLSTFQEEQDRLNPWGSCYHNAVTEVNRAFDTNYSTEIIKPEITVEELRAQVTF